jgi:oxygen-independent coproporphyrinogen-3 oxidase
LDSIYFGGGTPSLLEPGVIAKIFTAIRAEFTVETGAEVTVECAPGQLSGASLAAWQAHGVNRLSFGVQSFIDRECAAVGRLHTGAECTAELRRMQTAGVSRLGIDLIAGLPHQTAASWRHSIEQAIGSGVEHVSVYMLEVDEDSRLGREAIAGGRRYGAGDLPEEDRVADWYEAACEWLGAAGLHQYEISNFARAGGQSRHNRKYWERDETACHWLPQHGFPQYEISNFAAPTHHSTHNLKYWQRAPYLGFGLDAHSMLRDGLGGVRWANADEMGAYVGRMGTRGFERTIDRVGREAAFEEELFLGLRLVEGVDLSAIEERYGMAPDALQDLQAAGLVQFGGNRMSLTARGRMASNEVFERLLVGAVAQT